MEGVRGYRDITRYPHARQMPGLLLFRWDAPLFFANAEFFKERVLDAVASSATKVKRVVVAAEPVTSVDVTAADSLVELDDALRDRGAKLCFAELKDPVMDKLKRFGIYDRFGDEFFFATLGAAVDAYQGPTARIERPSLPVSPLCTQRTPSSAGARKRRHTTERAALEPLENAICKKAEFS